MGGDEGPPLPPPAPADDPDALGIVVSPLVPPPLLPLAAVVLKSTAAGEMRDRLGTGDVKRDREKRGERLVLGTLPARASSAAVWSMQASLTSTFG